MSVDNSPLLSDISETKWSDFYEKHDPGGKYFKDLNQKIDEKNDSLSLIQEILVQSHMEKISKKLDMTDLNLYDCIHLGKKLGYFSNLHALKRLDIAFGHIRDADLADLKDLKNLEYLGLTQNSVSGTGLKYISDNLKSLNMQGTPISRDGLVEICANLTNLERLVISISKDDPEPLDNQSIELIGSSLNHLQYLYLSDLHEVTDISPLSQLDNLIELDLYDFKNLTKFSSLPNLKQLDMTDLSKLIRPNIQNNMPALESLNMRGPLGDARYLKNLKILGLRGNPERADGLLQDQDLENLQNMTTLVELDLRCNRNLTDALFVYLRDLKNLKKINLNNSKCTKKAATKFKETYNPDLEFLCWYKLH